MFNGGSIANSYFKITSDSKRWIYLNSIESSNLHSQLIASIKKVINNKKCIYRVAGPFRNYRGFLGVLLDCSVACFILGLADHIVYQSKWSKINNHKNKIFSISRNITSSIIYNGFVEDNDQSEINEDKKTKEICFLSWSNNKEKGMIDFLILSELLPSDQYSFLYIGRIDKELANLFPKIRFIGVLSRDQVRIKINQCYAGIFSSRYEACSNALIELSTILKRVAVYNGSSNPEIVTKDGLYSSIEELYKNVISDNWSELNQKTIKSWESVNINFKEKLSLQDKLLKPNKLITLIRILIFVPIGYFIYCLIRIISCLKKLVS